MKYVHDCLACLVSKPLNHKLHSKMHTVVVPDSVLEVWGGNDNQLFLVTGSCYWFLLLVLVTGDHPMIMMATKISLGT